MATTLGTTGIEGADCQIDQWRCSHELDDQSFYPIRTRLALEYSKWDPRIGDTETLARFALILPASIWRQLSGLAELLATEAIEAERELLGNPKAFHSLGLPPVIAKLFSQATIQEKRATPGLARVIRFDFHPTTAGWKISEANTDVPGGYAEASEFPRLLAEHLPDTASAGHPGDALAKALLKPLPQQATIGLLSAPGYNDDLQVISYLANRLRAHGAAALLMQPEQVRWRAGQAQIQTLQGELPLDGIVRFYQGEWLARRPRLIGWENYFFGGITPTTNPGTALLIESKRFPLTWPLLQSSLPTWKRLLPESVDPRTIWGREESGWVLKRSYSNTGDSVAWPGSTGIASWAVSLWKARLRPSRWVAQRRFESLSLDSPIGPVFPCLGVYTINGRAHGIYCRIANRPLIDYRAIDVAVRLDAKA